MNARIIVLSDNAQLGTWLKHRIEASREDTKVEIVPCAAFDSDAAPGGSIDLLIPVLDFAESGASESRGTAWLRRTDFGQLPAPVMVVAEDGNELSAVQSLRLGATDYLPRTLITPERLLVSIQYCLHSPRALATSASRMVGNSSSALPRDLIPRYTVLQKLGESQRATVYLANSAALGRNVALKVTRYADGDNGNFAHEYQAIGALSHPAVVDIYDYGVYDGREYIAMEYFPCGDLKARLQNPISESQSFDYLRRIAGALSVVHRAGILHRDLKPPNIMLRDNGQVVLIDFGLAKNLVSRTRSTAAGVLRGSPYYMSPEQAQGLELDVRSDLYSLGVIFFEMLTGEKPFTGATAVEVLRQHVDEPVPRLPPDLLGQQAIIDGLMAKAPGDRYASAEDLLNALKLADCA